MRRDTRHLHNGDALRFTAELWRVKMGFVLLPCRDNLELDVSFWRELHRQPSYSDILDMAKQHTEMVGLTATRRLVEIRSNRLRFPLMPAGRKQFFCDEE